MPRAPLGELASAPVDTVSAGLTEYMPGVALFDRDRVDDIFTLTGPLEERMGTHEGVIWFIHDNRRGIAEPLGVEEWDIVGMAAIYGRLLVRRPEVVRFAPIVYQPDQINPRNQVTGYREGVIVEFDGQVVESGEVKIAELDHIDWMEDKIRTLDDYSTGRQHPSQSQTVNTMSGIPK